MQDQRSSAKQIKF